MYYKVNAGVGGGRSDRVLSFRKDIIVYELDSKARRNDVERVHKRFINLAEKTFFTDTSR
jgi:hypothetical protein